MLNYDPCTIGCQAGWRKYEHNPVLGDSGDFCFDNHVLKVGDKLRMYFSWRTHYSIAYTESEDGLHWGERHVVLSHRRDISWEEDLNRPAIDYRDGVFHMWYSSQTTGGFNKRKWVDSYMEASKEDKGGSVIGYAWSRDGIFWERLEEPVVVPDCTWEKRSLMCPTILWDQKKEIYKLWYCGGGWFEPDAIGYAESKDGIVWEKCGKNPVFTPDKKNLWERAHVAGCQVIQMDGWYYMFYIGYEDLFKARICLARSKDGVSGWERHPMNPIISAGLPGAWDCESIYKPFLYYDEDQDRWLMYFNARTGTTERIGIAIHNGRDFWNG